MFSSPIWIWTLFQVQMSSGKFLRHENNMPMYVSIRMHMAVIWRIQNQDNDDKLERKMNRKILIKAD